MYEELGRSSSLVARTLGAVNFIMHPSSSSEMEGSARPLGAADFMMHLSTSSEMEGSARSFPLREYVDEDDEDSPTSIGLARSVDRGKNADTSVNAAGGSRLVKE